MWLLTAALWVGCEQPCVGVGCEEDFGAARLTVFAGADLPSSGVVEAATDSAVLTGTESDGPDWAVETFPGQLLIGSPLNSSVRSFTYAATEQTTSDSNGIIVGEADGDAFGHRIVAFDSGNGDRSLLISAPLHSVSASSRHDGAIYRFDGFGDGFTGRFDSLNASLRINGVESGGRFGDAMAACPDLDGDGIEEWLVAATRSNAGAEMGGSVTLILSTELADIDPQIGAGAFGTRWYSQFTGARAGRALSCRHDFTGDGIADLVIGAPYADSSDGLDATGAVYVLSGAEPPEPGLLSDSATHIVYGPNSNDWFGYSISAGDIDGDGNADLVVGAPGSDEARGAAYVWLQPTAPFADAATSVLRGDDGGDGFGRTVHTGDINADGVDDVIIGAPFLNPSTDEETFDAGSISVFFGKATWTGLADRIRDAAIEGDEQYQRTGRTLFLGDLDDDGHDDIVSVQQTAVE